MHFLLVLLHALHQDIVHFVPGEGAGVALDNVAGIGHLAQHLRGDLCKIIRFGLYEIWEK